MLITIVIVYSTTIQLASVIFTLLITFELSGKKFKNYYFSMFKSEFL